MKILITLIALSLGVGSANAQKVKEAKVPPTVKDAFKKQYPAAKVEKWEKEGANYEAEFDLEKVENSVLIDPSGKILETEIEIAVSELPAPATDYLNKNFAGKKIKEAAKITDADGKVSYEAEVKGVDYIFDSGGNLVKKEVGNDKDRENN